VAFPEKSDEERLNILRACFGHYARTVLDVFWFSRFTLSRLKRWVTLDESMEPGCSDRSEIWLTAHYGNWEIAGMAVANRGLRLISVAAELENSFVDRLFIRIREQTGQTIIPREGAILKLARGLKSGAKWAILLDQNTSPREGGIFVPFFGLPVPVSSAPAALALKLKIPVVCTFNLPEAGGRYRQVVTEILDPAPSASQDDPIQHLTTRMTAAVEALIRKEPSAWLWMYKRWKHPPLDTPLDQRWPPYARPLGPRELPENMLPPGGASR
jgi:KDO2-lipid IV(A) lauroyltransferase